MKHKLTWTYNHPTNDYPMFTTWLTPEMELRATYYPDGETGFKIVLGQSYIDAIRAHVQNRPKDFKFSHPSLGRKKINIHSSYQSINCGYFCCRYYSSFTISSIWINQEIYFTDTGLTIDICVRDTQHNKLLSSIIKQTNGIGD